MFRRIKTLWTLSKKDDRVLRALDGLTQEELDALPDHKMPTKAEFFGEGTAEEYVEQEREDLGMADWYRRLRDL
jgi:hypothetical protein